MCVCVWGGVMCVCVCVFKFSENKTQCEPGIVADKHKNSYKNCTIINSEFLFI